MSSFPGAIAAVGTGRTALGVLELEPPAKEDVVLVPSAAGGLGWLLAQAATAVGATVVAAAGSAERVAALAPLGADLVVDYSEPGWADRVRERTDGVTWCTTAWAARWAARRWSCCGPGAAR